MHEVDSPSSPISCKKQNISMEHEESGNVDAYTKWLSSRATRWCFAVHFPKPEMQEAWLGFSSSEKIKKRTVFIDMAIMILQLPIFVISDINNSDVTSSERSGVEIFTRVIAAVSLVIRAAFYLFVLAPDNFLIPPWKRIKFFPHAAGLCLLLAMIFLQIQISTIFDHVYSDYNDLSEKAWSTLCFNGTLDASTNQTCVMPDGGTGGYSETSTFTLKSKIIRT